MKYTQYNTRFVESLRSDGFHLDVFVLPNDIW